MTVEFPGWAVDLAAFASAQRRVVKLDSTNQHALRSLTTDNACNEYRHAMCMNMPCQCNIRADRKQIVAAN